MSYKLYHIDKPVLVDDAPAQIGREPSATYYGQPVMASHQYLNNYVQNGQLFSYTGPPDDTMNDTPGATYETRTEGNFYIVLGCADKNDTTNPNKLLGGGIIPWKYNAHYSAGAWNGSVAVTWQQSGGSEYDIFRRYAVSAEIANVTYGYQLPYDLKAWDLFKPPSGANLNFSYNPVANYTYGVLKTVGIQTAALGVWTMPDLTLTADQHHWHRDGDNHAYIAPGRAIRGYTGTGDPSLGDLIHYVGDTAKSDSLLWNNQRCLFQWGHPVGVYTASTSYVEMCTDARYVVRPQNYREQSGHETTIHPCIVAKSVNALVGDKAYVKITAYDDVPAEIDSWEVSFYNNTTMLYQYSDGTGSDGLNITGDAPSYIKIEMKAPNNGGTGELYLYTVALWQAPEW